jgi:hypothetical protein
MKKHAVCKASSKRCGQEKTHSRETVGFYFLVVVAGFEPATSAL